MRKNTKQVFDCLLSRQPCRKCESIWTDGMVVFSYYTPVGFFKDNIFTVVKKGCYSPTTTTHTNALVNAFQEKNYKVVVKPKEEIQSM